MIAVRIAAIALATVLISSPAFADILSPAPESVRVTVYRSPQETIATYEEQEGFDFEDPGAAGLVMVSETRTVEIPAGLSTLVFRGVADQIVPQTAALEGLPAEILESNFDYDLLTPGAVIAKSRGEHVQLVRTDTATGRTTVRDAILRTGPSGVVLDVDGTAEALDCSGLTEKLVFPRMPPGLADEPRLSMTVRAATAGKYTVQLSYLALGIDWSADYVARIDPDDRTLTLTGWLTLVNRAGTTFANTPAEVVAGDLARDEEETRPPGPTKVQEHPQCWPIGSFTAWPEIADRMFRKAVADDVAAAAPGMMANRELQEVIVTAQLRTKAQMRELGDYKLYAVPEPTTLAARQSKQVQFLSEHSVPFTRIYQFTADQDTMMEDAGEDVAPQRANVLLRLQNKESDGLGKPLPAGVVSVMESAGSGSLLAGQDKIDDTPVGLPVDLTLGTAMDVWIEPRVIAGRTIEHEDYDEHRLTIEVRLGNDKPVPITLEYRQPQQGENFRIVRESRPHTLKDGDMQWTFRLRPGERVTFRYSMQANE